MRAQCDLWGIQRSSAYYVPVEINSETLLIMKQIDKIFMECPFYGSRKITDVICKTGTPVNRKRISRLMNLMGIQAIYPRPSLSVSNPENKVFPYLLRNLVVRFPNHVWSTDITYIPMRSGFMYCVAVIDWFSRYVLAWDISNVQDTEFCLQVMNSSFSYGLPEIFNMDQGSQFTSSKFTGRLLDLDVRVSMDGRGRALDNVFIERLWRNLKYEDIYIYDYENPRYLREGMQRYFELYNFRRPHQALDYATPAEVYFGRNVGVMR